MNQGRQSVCPSLPLPDSKPRELCRFNDGADQIQVRRDSQREADPGLSSDQEQRREAERVWWGPILWLTLAPLSPGQPPVPPSLPPEYLPPLPTCPLVPLWHRKQQEFKLQTKEDSTWGEKSTAQEVWSAHVGCWWGEEGRVWEAIFWKKFFEEKDTGYRAWLLLFRIVAVGDEEDNEMNEVEWYEIMKIINLLKILFVMSSIFYSIVTSCSSLESACDQSPDLVPASQLEFFSVYCVHSPVPPGAMGLVTSSRSSPDIYLAASACSRPIPVILETFWYYVWNYCYGISNQHYLN